MTYLRWNREEEGRLYNFYLNGGNLNKVKKRFGRSIGSIISKLRRLSFIDERWLPVLKIYYHQFYEENKEAFANKNRKYYRRHKKERKRWYLEHREEKKTEFREYYKRRLKNRQHMEISGLESRVN